MAMVNAKGHFDTRGMVRRPHVYMLVAHDPCCGQYAFIKFGRSVDAYTRAAGLRTACPLPWIRYTIIECAHMFMARALERALLKHFTEHSCGGEWLKVAWLDQAVRRNLLRDTASIVRQFMAKASIIEVDPAVIVQSAAIKRHVNRELSSKRRMRP